MHHRVQMKTAATLKFDLVMTRCLYLILKEVAEVNNNVISAANLEQAWSKVIGKANERLAAALPDLSTPQVKSIQVPAIDGTTTLVNNKPVPASTVEVFLHAPTVKEEETCIVFKAVPTTVDNEVEYIAVGSLLDGNRVVKLKEDDIITCINNGWRYHNDRCIPSVMILSDSLYVVHDDVLPIENMGL